MYWLEDLNTTAVGLRKQKKFVTLGPGNVGAPELENCRVKAYQWKELSKSGDYCDVYAALGIVDELVVPAY